MTDNQILMIYLTYIQMFFVLRYVVKATFHQVPNYSFFKLLIVAFVPVLGYFIAMQKPAEVV